jgi:hypothetical protein
VRAVFGNNKSAFTKETCVTATGDMIEEIDSNVEIYPNPVDDRLYIETLTQTLTIDIFDIYGRLQDYKTTRLQDNLVIDVSNFKSGVYFVMIKTNDGIVTRRIVKQ